MYVTVTVTFKICEFLFTHYYKKFSVCKMLRFETAIDLAIMSNVAIRKSIAKKILWPLPLHQFLVLVYER